MRNTLFGIRAGRAWLTLLALLLVPACASQRKAPEPTPFDLPDETTTETGRPWPAGPLVKNEADRAVEARVRDLLGLAGLSPFDVRVESRRGHVSLAGEIGAPGAAQRLASAVGALKGVRSVQNELTVAAAVPPVVPAAVADPQWFSAIPSALGLLAIVSALFFAKSNRRRRLEEAGGPAAPEAKREEESRVA